MRLLVTLLAVALGLGLGPACGSEMDSGSDLPDERSARERADLDRLIESGLRSERPTPMSRDEQAFYAVTLHRRQVADDMAASTAGALAPLALAALVFAPQGPADLVLAVFPLHRLGEAAEFARKARKLRKTNQKSRKLISLHKRFEAELPEEARAVLLLAQKLGRAERRAFNAIARRTDSPAMVSTLMTRHLRGEADVVWLAGKLKRKGVDKDFVRRFTFDGDFVREFSTYDAHLSWRVLQDMVEGRRVAEGARAALALKIHGLMGERAAADIIRSSGFAARHMKGVSAANLKIGRGVGYRTIRGGDGSIDIMARGEGQILFAEVKNLSTATWLRGEQTKVLAQLKQHNRGIEDILLRSGESGSVAGKILMVAEDGFKAAMIGTNKTKFDSAMAKLGWKLELIPNRQIASVKALIDSLK